MYARTRFHRLSGEVLGPLVCRRLEWKKRASPGFVMAGTGGPHNRSTSRSRAADTESRSPRLV